MYFLLFYYKAFWYWKERKTKFFLASSYTSFIIAIKLL